MTLSPEQERALKRAQEMFRERLNARLQELSVSVNKASIGAGERYDAFRQAHSLAGTTATLGMNHLTPALRSVESMLEEDRPDWSKVKKAIERIFRLHAAASE
ncbi:MAG: Hpt domain-containing protein [Myxococcota bacterium]